MKQGNGEPYDVGKRSDFERRPSNKYLTPYKGVLPLIPYISHIKRFVEPCGGDGRLVRHLERHGLLCDRSFDLEPDSLFVAYGDALQTGYDNTDAVITNPPWERSLLHPMIMHFVETAPEAWLLFDSDWSNTKQRLPYMKWCTDIVPVGRLKWIENSKHSGKDNCSWFRFSSDSSGDTIFHS